jgi:NAD(P)-dependent dehydrogenase (short-subunit alcohol dehydrogenase family)
VPTALITGASSGIGRATALRLARSGWKVFAGVRSDHDGDSLVAEGMERIVPLILDVTDSVQIAAAAERVGAEGGALDALINNAGFGASGPLELLSLDRLREQLEVNVLGHVAVTQAMLPSLRDARGRIVFISSVGGRVAMAFTAPYAASKHAIEAIGDALRVELRNSGIQVALIEPGSVATPIWGKAREESDQVVIPPELAPYYGHAQVAMGKTIENTAKRGIPPERVAQTIERALGARRMKARYLIGADARAMVLAKILLPDLLFDHLARRALGV